MKFLLPIVLGVAGVGAGVAGGVALRPDAEAAGTHKDGQAAEADHGAAETAKTSGDEHGADAGHGADGEEYVKMGDQFIVPILKDARVRSLVVLSIDLEVAEGRSEAVYRSEPKLRDAFLTVLFDHANAGGFEGTFTSSGAMDILRNSLREAGRKAAGDLVKDVLITGVIRQDT